MDIKNPLNNIPFSVLNGKTSNPIIDLPNLPKELEQITKPQGLFGEATAAYCVTQHPELYTYAAIGGAVASATVLLGLIGLVALIGKIVKTVRGRA